ncbi:MAG: hypothetical protein R3F07_19215 [Opitutaceae bacterium]
MTDRLQKLREQRDFILRHLQWLDEEIALEAPQSSTTEICEPTPASVEPTGPGPATPAPVVEKPPAIVPDPLEDSHVHSLKSEVRKGCLLYFGIAWVLLLAVVGIVYLVYR